MEKTRQMKLLTITALVLAITGLTIGFAAFSTTLKIASSANVNPNENVFSVKFSTDKDSLEESEVTPSSNVSNLTTTKGVIDNSTLPTLTDLSANFNTPGQYVEYTFYARNEGEYLAYLHNINFVGEKVCEPTNENETATSSMQSACEAMSIKVIMGENEYTETTEITGHSLAQDAGEEIKVRLEYASSGSYTDIACTVTFPDITMIYSTIDNQTTIIPPTSEKVINIVSGDINTPGSVVAIGDEQFYVIGQENGNVKLLSMYNLHVGNQYDKENGLVALNNPTGIQNSKAIGYFNEYSAENPIIGITIFSNGSQEGTNYSNYKGSIVEGYVNSYADYLDGLGANIVEARLITKEELETLGCSSDEYSCSAAPSWVESTSYWSGSAYDATDVWAVFSGEYFGGCAHGNASNYGVRPVIIISTSEF